MHNGFNQIYNMTPKENSKAHKAKEANKREFEKVVCAKCKNSCEFKQENEKS